jgi:hypothetical protein
MRAYGSCLRFFCVDAHVGWNFLVGRYGNVPTPRGESNADFMRTPGIQYQLQQNLQGDDRRADMNTTGRQLRCFCTKMKKNDRSDA